MVECGKSFVMDAYVHMEFVRNLVHFYVYSEMFAKAEFYDFLFDSLDDETP